MTCTLTRTGTRLENLQQMGGFIEGVDRFDPLFFNISPRDAEILDPKVRLFLETVWNLIEDAGYTRQGLQSRYGGAVGVFGRGHVPAVFLL